MYLPNFIQKENKNNEDQLFVNVTNFRKGANIEKEALQISLTLGKEWSLFNKKYLYFQCGIQIPSSFGATFGLEMKREEISPELLICKNMVEWLSDADVVEPIARVEAPLVDATGRFLKILFCSMIFHFISSSFCPLYFNLNFSILFSQNDHSCPF